MSLTAGKLSQWELVFLGLAIYSISPFVRFYIPNTVSNFVELAGFFVLAYAFLQGNFREFQGNDNNVIKLFLIWTAIMIIRGDLLGNFKPSVHGYIGAVSSFIFDGSAGLAYFIPFITLMPLRLNSLNFIRQVGLFLCLLCLVLIGLHWEEVVMSTTLGMTEMETGAGMEASIRDASNAFLFVTFFVVFLSFCYNYFDGYLKNAFVVYLVVYFYIQSLGGGRGGTFLSVLYIALFIIIMYKYPIATINHKQKKWVVRLMAFVAVLGFAYIVSYMIRNNSFEYLIHRFEEGASGNSYLVAYNREILRRDLIADFNSHPLSWVIGRGVNGCFETSVHSINGMRDGIEYGYLHFVLKGGIPYLLMYVYLLLHSAYLGIFQSNNLLCKAMAFYCIVNIVALYTATGPDVTLRYFLVWFSICLLEKRHIRNLSDSTISLYINKKQS